MRDWLASLTFGNLLVATWSLYVMFVMASWAFGFDNVTGALGNLADRLGLEATEEVQNELSRQQPD